MTLTSYGVITIQTNFEEEAANFAKAAANAHRVVWQYLEWAMYAAEEVGVPILMDFTPYLTGALRESTEAHVWSDNGQFRLQFEQPAQNRYGTEYAPFVILGHATRNPEIRVPPNPYNVSAAEEMEAPMNEILLMAGRKIAADLTAYMRVA